MKLDRDFKREVDTEIKEASYVGKKILLKGIILVFILTVLGGGFTLLKVGTFDKYLKNLQRENYKESVAYNEQAASVLADSYKQYNEAETDTDKQAIMEYVAMKYPNLDDDTIENDTLRVFYNNCMK